jgi:hypothetical protein
MNECSQMGRPLLKSGDSVDHFLLGVTVMEKKGDPSESIDDSTLDLMDLLCIHAKLDRIGVHSPRQRAASPFSPQWQVQDPIQWKEWWKKGRKEGDCGGTHNSHLKC